MDKVKRVGVPCPFVGAVVDLELDIRGHPRRLDGGQVGADYLGGGILVSEVTEVRDESSVMVKAKRESGELHGPDAFLNMSVYYFEHVVWGHDIPDPVPMSRTFYQNT